MAIDFAVDVEHGDLTKKFWVIFLRHLIIFLNKFLLNFLLDLSLSLNVKQVCVLQSVNPLFFFAVSLNLL